jgi:cytoskeletal protein CcmA (bactofilin family)
MFGRRSSNPGEHVASLVGADVEIVGDVSFTGGIRIDGRVRGNVAARAGEGGTVVLSRGGRIDGRVRCADAVIDGCIVGQLVVDGRLELQPHARIEGEVRYARLRMHEGAAVTGTLVFTGAAETVEAAADPRRARAAIGAPNAAPAANPSPASPGAGSTGVLPAV